MKRFLLLLLGALLLALGGVDAARADKRVALVVGNGAYQHLDALPNPKLDARAVRDTLATLGFEVIYGEDLGQTALRRIIGRFAAASREADVAVAYFAGHGSTFGSTPYLVPVDAEFTTAAQMPAELVEIDLLLAELRQAKGVRIAIFDACRDNAKERELKRVASRGGDRSRGFARPRELEGAKGLIVAYATQYGMTAADGPEGQNSPFTAAMIQHLPTPAVDVSEVFRRVGRDVVRVTKGEQIPAVEISLYEDYMLVPTGPPPRSTPIVALPPPALPPPMAEPPAAPPGPPAGPARTRAELATLFAPLEEVLGKVRDDYVVPTDQARLLGVARAAMLAAFPATGQTVAGAGRDLPNRDVAERTDMDAVYRAASDILDRHREDGADERVFRAAMNGMLASLDPYSNYLDAKSFRAMKVQNAGQFGGLGLEVTLENGLVKVVAALDDAPAQKGGILAGDLILRIDGEDVQGLTLNQAVEKMRGPVKTPIRLTIRRADREPFDVTLIRDVIRIQAVRARVEGNVGILRITQFNGQTFDSLRTQIEKITAEIGAGKVKGFVLDLRNNPGGLLDQAVLTADAFLDRGEIVSSRGRRSDNQERFSAKPGDLSKGRPLVVLINSGTASGSEIVAGALQDHKRAFVIGTRSFGKGSVQTVIPLSGENAVRLTTAHFFSPAGRAIQARGIEPDQEVVQEVPEELKGKDGKGGSAFVPPDPTKDTQLVRALERLRAAPAAPAPGPSQKRR